ncbi:MAG TPA: alpha-glucuronidase family glycosyl hydrolase [Polyangiaceae bacterium]|nr:alpha-glucuronidase family glycosyl hydrolase [Polyangiaceae bacterium]
MTRFATHLLGLVLPGLVCLALGSACSSDKPGSSPGTAGASSGAGDGTGGGSAGSNQSLAGGNSASSGTAGMVTSSGGTGNGTGNSSGAGGGLIGSAGSYPLPDSLPDETGADLWLRYPKVSLPARLAEYQAAFTHVVSSGGGASTQAATDELIQGLSGLTATSVKLVAAVQGAGAIVVGTPTTSTLIAGLPLASELAALGPDGYLVRYAQVQDQKVIAIAGNTELGVLYGSFALLRQLATHGAIDKLSLSGSPKIKNRLLNHWDNLNGSVERGYAGSSLWNWADLPATLSPRYKAYARANASIGINGTVLNNVNSDKQVLTAAYIAKEKALADLFRPYGIKVYLSARFSAPVELGGLTTADPADPAVQKWWTDKAAEIYAAIPDFGGFLVKANSEGQPGPQTYKRTHAEGANLLAKAVAPHGGIVIWRAFVYSTVPGSDRIKQAYDEFKPLDGSFDANVLVQVKNGPLDFQPREPFHPLFGAMPKTPVALELQVTKEYLGEDTHLAYLGPMYEEVLKADTQVNGPGSTVARVVDGTLHKHALTAISGVANIGSDTNWTGSHFNQANWYVYGRMAWDPEASAQSVAADWLGQTFTNDPAVITPVVGLMMSSRQTLVNYMVPLGLTHIMGTDHHYGPAPWVSTLSQPEWNPAYYHKADTAGLGFDRTATGSNAVSQYASAVGQAFGTRATVSNDLLLFFHHVPWGQALDTKKTLWHELVHRYSQGVDDVGHMREAWATVKARVDNKRFTEVADFLQIQHYEARWWRDACLTYFATFSQLPIPTGYAMPAHPLKYYQDLTCPADVKKPRCPAVYTGEPSPAVLP